VGAALARLEASGQTPDLAVCLGSAGSRSLEQTGIYQVASVSYRDIDASPLGIPAGLTPYLDLPRELPLQVLLPDLPAVRLSTGGAVISGAAYDAIDADMVDMETFAVARACMTHGVPLAGLRGVSDGAADLNHMDDWQAYLHIIDEKLAAVVDRILAAAAN
jgi:adenosylhomocysteine nucleosidase